MRTIKFRGKRLDNGEWVYGYLYQFIHPSGLASTILTNDDYVVDKSLSPDDVAFKLWDDLFLVDDETVGQFTGLTDKDGKEIYEGDILLWTRKNVHIEGRQPQDLLYKCVVYYDNDKCAFQFRCELSCGACVGLLDFDDDRADESFVEVIGNVFDNPDMIEKGGEQ